MPDTKITDLAAINGATLASTDLALVVDVSDTTMASSGTDKKTTIADIATAVTSAGGLATTAAVSAGYQPLDSDLTAIAALTTTAFGQSLLTQADASAARSTLGVPITSVAPKEGDLLSWDSANSTYSPRRPTAGLNLAYGFPPVATRAYHPQDFSTGSGAGQQVQTRLRHLMLQDTYELRLVFANSTTSSTGGVVGGGTFTLEGAIETPQGVVWRLSFGGNKTVTMPPGAIAVSDPIALARPGPDSTRNPAWNYDSTEAYFWSRTLITLDADGGKTPKVEPINTGLGEGCETGTSLTNKVMTTGAIGTSGIDPFGPSAVVGLTGSRLPVVMALGDSITSGTGDTPTVGTPGGYVMRALYAARIPTVRHGAAGERLSNPANNESMSASIGLTFSLPFLNGCSHAITQWGINDVGAGTALADMKVLYMRMWVKIAARGVKVYQCTLTPRSTSTDSWATTVNQTTSADNSIRTGVNDWVRDGAPCVSAADLTAVAVGTTTAGTIRAGDVGHPLTGYFEAADLAESARNSGIWKANYTADGLHPNATGCAALVPAIDTAVFTV